MLRDKWLWKASTGRPDTVFKFKVFWPRQVKDRGISAKKESQVSVWLKTTNQQAVAGNALQFSYLPCDSLLLSACLSLGLPCQEIKINPFPP
jgi:hypothetical protein